MEQYIDRIKSEPVDACNIELSERKVKLEPDDVEITEIDWNTIFHSTGDGVIAEPMINTADEYHFIQDEIIKEEPAFYDESSRQIILMPEKIQTERDTTMKSKFDKKIVAEVDKIYQCFICGCQTGSVKLLQCHIKERHPVTIRRSKSHLLIQKNEQPLKEKQTNKLKPRTKVECSTCKKHFFDKGTLKQHERIHLGKKYKCTVCLKYFSQKHSLKVHERIHTGEKPYKCSRDDCNMKFRLKHQLTYHNRAHANGTVNLQQDRLVKLVENIPPLELSECRSYECFLCAFKGHRNNVRLHIKKEHTKDRLFECSICKRQYISGHSLAFHMETHKLFEFNCSICDKVFNRKDALKMHIQSHTGNYPFECKYCPKKFTKKSSFDIHVRLHTGLKPFECEHCKKRFAKKSDMVRHSRTHTGERPYRCDLCDMTFTRNHTLTDHKHSIHKL